LIERAIDNAAVIGFDARVDRDDIASSLGAAESIVRPIEGGVHCAANACATTRASAATGARTSAARRAASGTGGSRRTRVSAAARARIGTAPVGPRAPAGIGRIDTARVVERVIIITARREEHDERNSQK
jgi:hypothetical protein